jgi:cation:H+ antiporter
MILPLIVFLIGMLLLVKGSDFLVDSSSTLAKNFGVSEMVIGLTLISIGTSLPEFVTSVLASFEGYGGIAIGDVVGSNVCNIAMVVGISSIFYPITLKDQKNQRSSRIFNGFYRDHYIMIIASILLFILSLDEYLEMTEGVFLLIFFLLYMYLIVREERSGRSRIFDQASEYVIEEEKDKEKKLKMLKTVFIFLVSLFAVIFGAKLTVDGAVSLADIFGISEEIIAIILIAIGTSLPELAVSFSSAKKGKGELAIGNIVGSNTFNILLIIGSSSIINTIFVSKGTILVAFPFMILVALLLFFFVRDRKIERYEGLILFSIYIIFISAILKYL